MQVYRVEQELVSSPISDIAAAVRGQLEDLNIKIPAGAQIALTAGSRGIDNIAAITRVVGDWLRGKGAEPFLVPCMGSHNGATAEGQRAMVESLGLTEAAMNMPIRSSMEVVEIGEVPSGKVYMDRHCREADGVFVINRIKLHTCFTGSVQSGLLKMMVVGMGKINSARTFHTTPASQMAACLLQMGRVILDSGKIIGGLAILEDGYDRTAEVHAVGPEQILQMEPELVKRHLNYFPRLPVEDLNVLIVQEIGKTYSGTGMDTNVIGRFGVQDLPDPPAPRIRHIAALRLAEKSQGNAIGIGLADFITQPLRDAIDEKKTLINVLTTGEPARGKIPLTFSDDRTLIETLADRFGAGRWMFIPNTLHLETLYVSADLADELRAHPRCRVEATSLGLPFSGPNLALGWS